MLTLKWVSINLMRGIHKMMWYMGDENIIWKCILNIFVQLTMMLFINSSDTLFLAVRSPLGKCALE